MQKIRFNGKDYCCDEKQTVLDVLLADDVSIPHSCRVGVCHSCLVKAVKGKPSAHSQVGLKDTLQKQKYFLACQCLPENYMEIVLPGDEVHQYISTTVVAKEKLSENIVRLTLKPDEAMEYSAGQFTNFYRNDGLIRSYSIASVPSLDQHLEFHIQKIDNGRMSAWVHDQLAVGDSLTISEPVGESFYVTGKPEQNLLLIGTGSGLAPLFGVLRDALSHGHSGEIWLYHGSSEAQGLYLQEELKQIEKQYANFHYIPCQSRGEASDGVRAGRAHEHAIKDHADLKGWRLFLCGHPEMVNQTKRLAFLNGASLKEINSDPFLFAPDKTPNNSK